jgi:hypothetical protein
MVLRCVRYAANETEVSGRPQPAKLLWRGLSHDIEARVVSLKFSPECVLKLVWEHRLQELQPGRHFDKWPSTASTRPAPPVK